jgi:hypothetical protein
MPMVGLLPATKFPSRPTSAHFAAEPDAPVAPFGPVAPLAPGEPGGPGAPGAPRGTWLGAKSTLSSEWFNTFDEVTAFDFSWALPTLFVGSVIAA